MLYGEIIRQHLKLISEHVVADTIDYLEMKFSFQTDDWNGLEKWAHFARKGTVYDIRLTDDCIRKEDHLNLSAGIWKVYLHGNEYRDGEVIERITTCVETLEVNPTGMLNGEPFPEMPASVTEQILARLDNVEQNGGGSGGLNPVDKTDAMTAEVGRDDEGRLWVDPTGTGHGLSAVAFGMIYKPEKPEESGNALFFHRDNSNDLYVLLSELFEKMGISRFTVKAVPPTAEDVGKATDGWFDIGTQTLYICEGRKSGVYKWTPVSGSGSGLPEYTEADEGKFMRIINGAPVWSAVINGEEVKF